MYKFLFFGGIPNLQRKSLVLGNTRGSEETEEDERRGEEGKEEVEEHRREEGEGRVRRWKVRGEGREKRIRTCRKMLEKE
jgi:hypothetical protein